jgi:hypothetical protein
MKKKHITVLQNKHTYCVSHFKETHYIHSSMCDRYCLQLWRNGSFVIRILHWTFPTVSDVIRINANRYYLSLMGQAE